MPIPAADNPASTLSRFRRRLVDGFIAVVLLILVIDVLPFTPARVRGLLNPLLNVTGLWQGTWTLFAPLPSTRNQRLRADIEYADGSKRVWKSPEWRSQTPWQRFVGHRESEFLEKIHDEMNSPAWPAFTEYVVRSENLVTNEGQRPRRVEMSVIWGDIPPPGRTWPTTEPVPLDHERVFFTLIYPD